MKHLRRRLHMPLFWVHCLVVIHLMLIFTFHSNLSIVRSHNISQFISSMLFFDMCCCLSRLFGCITFNIQIYFSFKFSYSCFFCWCKRQKFYGEFKNNLHILHTPTHRVGPRPRWSLPMVWIYTPRPKDYRLWKKTTDDEQLRAYQIVSHNSAH